MDFAHLHVHNSFSFLDGIGTAEDYAKKAKELNYKFLSLTNHGNIDGLIRFQNACEKEGIIPIHGCEIYLVPDEIIKEKGEKRSHITLLIKNQIGWRNLCQMLSKANIEGFYYRPRVGYKTLLEHSEGLVCLTGCTASFLMNDKNYHKYLNKLIEAFNEDLYLEGMPHGLKDQIQLNNLCIKLSEKYNLPIIGSNDCHYVTEDQSKIQEVLLAIQSNAKWNDPNRWKFNITGLHLRSVQEMKDAFIRQGVFQGNEIDNILDWSIDVCEKCKDFKIEKQNISLPTVPGFEGNAGEITWEIAEKKLLEISQDWNTEKVNLYFARLRDEWKLIEEKKFHQYFLIVHELILWCKKNNIMTGAGRGCFTGDTKVSLLDGTEKTFYELVKTNYDKEFWVYSCDKNGNIVPGKAKNPRMTKIARKICKIKLDNGDEISCTTDHKFLMRNGEYKEAKNLSVNDSLMPLYRSYTNKGYEKYYSPKENTFIFTHYMNFKYKHGFVIHHKDFNKRNNCPENLEQLGNKAHGDLHAQTNSDRWEDPNWREKGIKRYWKVLGSKENRRKTSERNKTKEHRKKVSEGQKRIWEDKDYKNRMIEGTLSKLNSPEAIDERKSSTLKTCNEIMNSPEGIQKTIERNKSKEHRNKVSAGRVKYFLTPEGIKERKKIRDRMKNRVVSEETRKKISNSKLGKPAWNKGISTGKGIPKTEETKRKISEALKGKSKSQEHRNRLSEARKRFFINKEIKNHKVVSVLFVNEKKEMYDIEVEKYHNFALSSGVFVHNSVGGSLLAYLLNITCVDPIQYNLLFSRFIAPDRIDLPDIDQDFEDTKRHLVREHLESLYGKENISSLSTFLSLKGKGIIRDVARVFEVPLSEVNKFTKFIDNSVTDENNKILPEAFKTEEGKLFYQKYTEVCDIAAALEGTKKTTGQHAAALIISSEDLRNGNKGNLAVRSGELVSNWDMQDSEHIGLIKLDVLGLNTLSILNEAKRLIKNNKDIEINFEKIPLNDQDVFDYIREGNTVGMFQLSTWAMTNLVKQFNSLSTIEELSDIIALVRPGPFKSGMTALYVDRKNNGTEWERLHKKYEDIVKKTQGIVIYQEQIMEVVNKVAGLPYATADKIRKVISKKRDVAAFKPYEDAFIKGCLEQKTFSKKQAQDFWAALKEHSHYSFNLSHSIEYAILSYWTAYTKFYFPYEFLCACLTYGSEAKKEGIIEEAYRLGLTIVPPRIGVSDSVKWQVKDQALYVPFIEIKGIGEKTAYKCSDLTCQIQETKTEKKTSVKKLTGFFKSKNNIENIKSIKEKKTKIEKILLDIGAYGNKPSDNMQDYFSFRIGNGVNNNNQKLITLVKNKDGDGILELNIKPITKEPIIQEKSFSLKKGMSRCRDCELREQCDKPVPPSSGQFNIAIVGEAPGKVENEQGKGFVGRSGELVWRELSEYDLNREDFHVSNACHCFPYQTKTPTQKQIETCSNKWLFNELQEINCRLILAFGNSCVTAFTGKNGGITSLNGKTEWNEKIGAWICWCIHPSAVLRDGSKLSEFKKGIANFVSKIELLEEKQITKK